MDRAHKWLRRGQGKEEGMTTYWVTERPQSKSMWEDLETNVEI